MVKPKAVSKSIPTDVATDVASTDVATDAATDADATIAVTNDAATGAKAKNLLEKLEVLCRHGQEKWVLATQTYDMVSGSMLAMSDYVNDRWISIVVVWTKIYNDLMNRWAYGAPIPPIQVFINTIQNVLNVG